MARPSETWIQQQRERKAMDLEDIAVRLGIGAAELAADAARDRILAEYAKAKGKRPAQVHASIETWRCLWRLMHDRETRGQGTAVNPFIGRQP